MKFRMQSYSLKEENNKKDKGNVICYECGKPGHYKPDCPSLAKKKGKGQINKPRQAYVAWESESESSSDERSSESDEEVYYCFMENHRQGKKKDGSYKYSNISTLSYNELEREFEKLQLEFLNANKKLASQEKVFTFLEAKFDEINY